MRRKIISFVGLFLLLLLAGCKVGQIFGPKPTPTPTATLTPTATSTPDPLIIRSGEWQGETESGEFSFVISPDGTHVTEFYFYNKTTDEVFSFSGTETDEEFLIDQGMFAVVPWDGKIWFVCQFSDDGKRASGFWRWDIWTTPEDSAEEWQVER